MRYDPRRHVWQPLSITDVGRLFAGAPARWWLSGGQAVDHRLGATTRAHGDIDVSTLRPGLGILLARLPGPLQAFAAMDGQLLPLRARLDDPALHNIWVHDDAHDRWVLQINLEEGDAARWRYRRDPRVELPWDRAVEIVRSIPTGTPVAQLLWKSRDPRPCDEHDLDVLHASLGPEERQWLRDAVRTAHPGSVWADDPRIAAGLG